MRAEKMNTVCLLGSPRRGGNSDRLAEHFLRHANDLGAPVETFALSELQYSGCQNLFRCKTDLDHCGLQDDLTPVLSATPGPKYSFSHHPSILQACRVS